AVLVGEGEEVLAGDVADDLNHGALKRGVVDVVDDKAGVNDAGTVVLGVVERDAAGGDCWRVVDGIDGDGDGVGVGESAAGAGVALVVGGNGERRRTVVVCRWGEAQAIEGGVDRGDGA